MNIQKKILGYNDIFNYNDLYRKLSITKTATNCRIKCQTQDQDNNESIEPEVYLVNTAGPERIRATLNSIQAWFININLNHDGEYHVIFANMVAAADYNCLNGIDLYYACATDDKTY